MKPKQRHTGALLLRYLVYFCAALTVSILVILVGYILWQGVPELKPSLFAWTYTSDNASMMPAIINPLSVTVFSLPLSVPLGVCSAIYLSEVARRRSCLVSVIRLTP